jgi:hypothetical protein
MTMGVGSGGAVALVVMLTGADAKPVPEALVAVAEQL